MAFTSTIAGRTVAGNKRMHWGAWDGTGVTGGDIDTGLVMAESVMLTNKGTALEAAGTAVVNETLPIAGNAITIVCTSGDAGYWMAIGH